MGRRRTQPNGPRNNRAWTVITFEELEAWREGQGLPKKRVAELLGVTNSTYHNWARSIAVATPATQQRIYALIHGGAGAAPGAPFSMDGGSGSEAVLVSTGRIVTAYLRARKDHLTPEALCDLIRRVTRALDA